MRYIIPCYTNKIISQKCTNHPNSLYAGHCDSIYVVLAEKVQKSHSNQYWIQPKDKYNNIIVFVCKLYADKYFDVRASDDVACNNFIIA